MTPLSDLNQKDEFDKITVRAKVIKCNDPQKVGTGKVKQDVTIADATGKTTRTLWEAYVNQLQPQNSYQISRVMVKIFMGQHNLSIPMTGSIIEEISDVENLESDTDEDDDQHLCEVTVVGVQQLEFIYSCMNCKQHIEPTTNMAGVCNSCNTIQRLCNPKLNAKLFVQDKADIISLRAHGDIVRQIANKDDNIKHEDLLFASPFDLTHNKFHVITSIKRP